MFGTPRRIEIHRYRGLWYRWGGADRRGQLARTDPERRRKQRCRERDAVGRAGRRAQVPVPHSLYDL